MLFHTESAEVDRRLIDVAARGHDDRQLGDIVRQFPQTAREWAENALWVVWPASYLAGREAAAEEGVRQRASYRRHPRHLAGRSTPSGHRPNDREFTLGPATSVTRPRAPTIRSGHGEVRRRRHCRFDTFVYGGVQPTRKRGVRLPCGRDFSSRSVPISLRHQGQCRSSAAVDTGSREGRLSEACRPAVPNARALVTAFSSPCPSK